MIYLTALCLFCTVIASRKIQTDGSYGKVLENMFE